MKSFLYILLFCCGITYAQRETSEIIDASGIEKLNIQTDEAFSINISTGNMKQVKISTRSEGEYYRDILLDIEVRDDELVISTMYPERLTGGYDKLSAHKVFSMEIDLQIPEGLEVSVRSNIANLVARGSYRSIYAGLKQGYCHLLEFSGAATVNTYSGDILVETSRGLVEAESRHGKVEIPEFLPGRNPIRLTSIDGDIRLRKTK